MYVLLVLNNLLLVNAASIIIIFGLLYKSIMSPTHIMSWALPRVNKRGGGFMVLHVNGMVTP